MASKITKIKIGTMPGIMPGDKVTNKRNKPDIYGVCMKINGGIITIRPLEGKNRMPMDVLLRDVQLTRRKDRLSAEIGCLVTIHNGVVGGNGYLGYINGGYNYVREGSVAGTEHELYPNEFSVKAVFRHPDYMPGTIVRFADPDKIAWGKDKRTTHGIVRGVSEAHIVVQPITSKEHHLLFLAEDEISLETGKMREPMDETELAELELSKLAIRALLVTCGSMTIGQLVGLLATQAQNDEDVIRANVFAIIADGKAHLDKDHVFLTSDEKDDCVQGPIRETLFASTEAVRLAKKALADAVFKTIADTGARLPR